MELNVQQKQALALAAARKRKVAAAQTGGVVPQALSGVNEGAANFLSLPNNVIGAAEIGLRSIGPGLVNLFGGNAQMPTEPLLKLPDAGEAYRAAATEIGAIKPETDEAAGQFARRVGQEVGANIIPTMGVPAKVASMAASVGSGVGAAAADMIAPDNPLAEFAGQMIGGGLTVGAANAIERHGLKTAAPSLDDLKVAKNAAYRAVDKLGVVYSPQAVDDLIARMEATGAKINPLRHQAAKSVLDDIRTLKGKPLTLTQLDELRQVIARDLIKTPDGGNRFFGYEFKNTLDDFINRANPSMLQSGDAVAASTAINKARELNTRFRKVEDFERQMGKATTAAASSGSGGNINNQIRQKARQILDNPKRTLAYSDEELAALEKLITQGAGEDILRTIGKLAPGGNGLMTALNTGAIVHNPALAGIPAIAQIAKFLADRGTGKQAEILRALLARGGPVDIPALGPRSQQVLEALLTTQAANQNAPRSTVMDALKASGQ